MSKTRDSKDNFSKISIPAGGALIVDTLNINTISTATTTNATTTIWDPTNFSASATINIGPLKNEDGGQEKAIRGKEAKSIVNKLKIEDFPLGRFKHAIDLFREALSCYENGDYMASTIMCRTSIESMLFLCIVEIEKSADGKNFELKLDNMKRDKYGAIKNYNYSDNLWKAESRGYLDGNVRKWLSTTLDKNDKDVGLIRYSGDFVAHYSEKLIKDLKLRKKSIVPVNLWVDSESARDIIEKTCITLKSINKNYRKNNDL